MIERDDQDKIKMIERDDRDKINEIYEVLKKRWEYRDKVVGKGKNRRRSKQEKLKRKIRKKSQRANRSKK